LLYLPASKDKIMSATVDTVDDEVTPVIEFVGQALGGDASCYRRPAPYRPDDGTYPHISAPRQVGYRGCRPRPE
jgi:hypothetical protein